MWNVAKIQFTKEYIQMIKKFNPAESKFQLITQHPHNPMLFRLSKRKVAITVIAMSNPQVIKEKKRRANIHVIYEFPSLFFINAFIFL